ncbi:MAG: hypothetical protein CMH31_01705 [Micavibrio sp.]|nr:hypothetical protein [Micavibrio sp.]
MFWFLFVVKHSRSYVFKKRLGDTPCFNRLSLSYGQDYMSFFAIFQQKIEKAQFSAVFCVFSRGLEAF